MKKKITFDEDKPSGHAIVVPDFLPPPHELVIPSDLIKVTLHLDRYSVGFLKAHAQKSHTSYQRMIREVVRRYVESHTKRRAA